MKDVETRIEKVIVLYNELFIFLGRVTVSLVITDEFISFSFGKST